MNIRNIEPEDFAPIISVIDDWWGGRKMSHMLPRLFFTHFRETSFVIEDRGEVVGFLVGFLSQSFSDEAYIHFVGVRPDHRKRGVGQLLYEHFFDVIRRHNRGVVRCVTSPVNKDSIAFHTRMGFEIEPSEHVIDGIPCFANYDGRGGDRVLFKKSINL